MTQKYDALIIGAGHNGLVCAFYLARAGLKVRIVERRDVVGGAAVTEEFHPGSAIRSQHVTSLLQPKVIADMKLATMARVIERPIATSAAKMVAERAAGWNAHRPNLRASPSTTPTSSPIL
jgi:phytoene dehydrogenase-like protein